jgi:hypothetical protein
MCLRVMLLLTTRLAAWLRLARREETWKTAEILILRHQLAAPDRPASALVTRAFLLTLAQTTSAACDFAQKGTASPGRHSPTANGDGQ